jgi:hypothetical protein
MHHQIYNEASTKIGLEIGPLLIYIWVAKYMFVDSLVDYIGFSHMCSLLSVK